MSQEWSRRKLLGAAAGVGTGCFTRPVLAQSGGGVLERLRKAGSVKIGIANAPPYSSLKPDGTPDGVAPSIVKVVMERLGVPKLEASTAPYGQMIPGLQAGRWDIIGASMSVSKARCELVRFADPFTIDHNAVAYIPSVLPDPPHSIAETPVKNVTIGVTAGSYVQAFLEAVQTKPGMITVFPDGPSLIEGLLAKRVQTAFTGVLALRTLRELKNNAFEIFYPIPDDGLHASSACFRLDDTDLYDAFQVEFRKMRKSGEAERIVARFGFDMKPEYLEVDADRACAEAT